MVSHDEYCHCRRCHQHHIDEGEVEINATMVDFICCIDEFNYMEQQDKEVKIPWEKLSKTSPMTAQSLSGEATLQQSLA